MKRNLLKGMRLFAGAVLAGMLFYNCEGPAGIDGADGNVTCLVCHENNNLVEKIAQYAKSSHMKGEVTKGRTGSGWSASCVRCHTGIGFEEFATSGVTTFSGTSEEGFTCGTCHDLHNTFTEDDLGLRISEPAAFIVDAAMTADFGAANLCASCHQNRTAEPNVAAPADSFKITSTHYGPHHGPQSNILYGMGLAEVGTGYQDAGQGVHFKGGATCVSCHMGSDMEHSFEPDVATCNACHNASETDFDHGGVQTEVAANLLILRDLLVNRGVIEYVEADLAYEPIVKKHSMLEAQAYFNWIAITEDRSLGAHNPKYVTTLLDNTIAALSAK